MKTYLIVVSRNPVREPMSDTHPERIAGLWGCVEGWRWLTPGYAYEVQVSGEFDAEIKASNYGVTPPIPAFLDLDEAPDAAVFVEDDYTALPSANRRKKLLVADMESTIIEQECLDELADYVGLRDRVADITERAMRGDLDFEAALRERVRLLKGLSIDLLDDLYASKVSLMPGAEILVATMAANGAHCALVSGGFTFFTSRIAERLGFHTHQANELIIENGELTGEVGAPILGRAAKKQALDRLCVQLNITAADAITVGDGANDLDMLTAAGDAGGIGVAYHAKPIVAETAPHRITHGDLTALLFLQGYTQSEFVNPD